MSDQWDPCPHGKIPNTCAACMESKEFTHADALLRIELLAAEERGRRRGIEEWDELRDRMHQTIAFLLSVIASGEKLSDEEEAGIRAMLREGLAPRDSGEKP